MKKGFSLFKALRQHLAPELARRGYLEVPPESAAFRTTSLSFRRAVPLVTLTCTRDTRADLVAELGSFFTVTLANGPDIADREPLWLLLSTEDLDRFRILYNAVLARIPTPTLKAPRALPMLAEMTQRYINWRMAPLLTPHPGIETGMRYRDIRDIQLWSEYILGVLPAAEARFLAKHER